MIRTLFLNMLVLLTMIPLAAADPVTFRTSQYGCDLRIFGETKGRIEPGKSLTIELPRGQEYLAECESNDVPVKLYDRINVFSRGDLQNGALPAEVNITPVAVLPNVVRAAAKGNIDVMTNSNTSSVICEIEANGAGHLTSPAKALKIPVGRAVQLSSEIPFKHCGDTNLIEVIVGGSKAWFPNRDFSFSYKGKPIDLFLPSQEFACCWIE